MLLMALPPITVSITDINGIVITSVPNTGTSTVRFTGNAGSSDAQPIAEFSMANSSIANAATFSGITMGTQKNATGRVAFVHGLTSANGFDGTSFTLYVPRDPSDAYLIMCPGASSISSVLDGCPNQVHFLPSGAVSFGTPGGMAVTIVSISGEEYWKVTGVTGTGGRSIASNSAPTTSGGGGGGIFSSAGSSLLNLIAFGGSQQTISNPVNTGLVLGSSTLSTGSAISGFKFNYNMRVGSRISPDVVNLQARLGVIQTGFFGPLTYAAVVKYQRANGIPATGFVGPLTRAALNK